MNSRLSPLRRALYGRLTQAGGSIAAALIPFLEHDDANRASDGFKHAASGSADAEGEKPLVGTEWSATSPLIPVFARWQRGRCNRFR